jgi:uncharacterized protein
MRLRVDEIPEAGRFLHFHWDEAKLRQFQSPADPHTLHTERPLNVDLEIHRKPDHVRIRGAIHAVLQLACHRCLETFSWRLEQPVDTFLIRERGGEWGEEDEPGADDLDYEFFDGEVIDIDRLVAEQVFLALPVKALCAESCLGICPRCGANRNSEPCRCPFDADRKPFAVLQGLKGPTPQEPGS